MRREFTAKVEEQARARAAGRCEECGGMLKPGHSQVDHIKPCALGGSNELDNAQVLCTVCHLRKTMELDMPSIRKGDKDAKPKLEVASGMTEIQRRFGIK
jgi:5-methylcytosine-specific restriction endonuclease McrA